MSADTPEPDRRHLGEAWSDWGGDDDGFGDAEATVGLFVWPAFLALGAWAASLAVLWFLVAPRLAQAWLWLPDVLAAGLTTLTLATIAWWARLGLVALSGRGRALSRFERLVLLRGLLPATLGMGRLIGTSPDRLTNAFLKLHNALTVVTRRRVAADRLVVLLPRCLSKEIRHGAKEITVRHGCHLHVVPGGSEARRVIRKRRPYAIVAVACERDLLSGVEEVGLVLPVLALPNRRPAGPCRGTEIDLADLDAAIRFFLGEAPAPDSITLRV
jgi:uncharacterized protein